MSEELVPDQDHVARYCRPKQIDAGKIQPSAIAPNTKSETRLRGLAIKFRVAKFWSDGRANRCSVAADVVKAVYLI